MGKEVKGGWVWYGDMGLCHIQNKEILVRVMAILLANPALLLLTQPGNSSNFISTSCWADTYV